MEKNEFWAQEVAADFTKNDFCQCFEQMRYYDSQILNIFKYLAGFYTTIAGAAIGLYQYYSVDREVDIRIALATGLVVASFFGVAMFALIVRNRVYFVCVSRYVNELRKTFLSFKPLGFENKSKMYTNVLQPPYFNWRSSQSWWMYIVALQNSLLIGIAFYVVGCEVFCIAASGFLAIVIQLFVGIAYLKNMEGKSVSKAVFGKDILPLQDNVTIL